MKQQVNVEDFTSFTIWLIGYRDGQPTTVPITLVRANATVPLLLTAMSTGKLGMTAVAPMNQGIVVQGVRVTYSTKTIKNGQAETPLVDPPLKLAAGRAVQLVYDLASGVISINPI